MVPSACAGPTRVPRREWESWLFLLIQCSHFYCEGQDTAPESGVGGTETKVPPARGERLGTKTALCALLCRAEGRESCLPEDPST